MVNPVWDLQILFERALDAELTHHYLGYEMNNPAGRGSRNSRNGKGRKKLKGDNVQ
jgi:putative transposase